MREYLFHGKRIDNGEWVEGGIIPLDVDSGYVFIAEPFLSASTLPVHEIVKHHMHLVYPESVGQYTGMNEFVAADSSYNKPLFEGDIVEVWGWRTVLGRQQSQYDEQVKVRGVIYFGSYGWHIDYDNNYNRSLAKLKGAETKEREVSGASNLNYYGCHSNDREKYRAERLEWHGRFHNTEDISGHYDIKKIGNVFDNKDLLEG